MKDTQMAESNKNGLHNFVDFHELFVACLVILSLDYCKSHFADRNGILVCKNPLCFKNFGFFNGYLLHCFYGSTSRRRTILQV